MRRGTFAIRLFLVYFILMLAALSAVLLINYNHHNSNYQALLEEYETRTMLRIGDQLSTALSEIGYVAMMPIYSDSVQNCLVDKEMYPYKSEKVLSLTNINGMKDFVNQTYYAQIDIKSILFFCRTGRILYSDDKMPSPNILKLMDNPVFSQTSLYVQAKDIMKGKDNYWGKWTDITEDDDDLVHMRIIRNRVRQEIALMVMTLDEQELDELFGQEIKEGELVFITDDDGNICYQSDDIKQMGLPEEWTEAQGNPVTNFKGRADTGEYLITSMRLEGPGWNLSRVVPLSKFMNPISAYVNILLAAAGIILLAAVTFYMASRYLVRPISLLVDGMHHIEEGDFSIRLPEHGGDEMRQLFKGFNHMASRLHSMIEKVYVAELQQRKAQILALQSQINPHFLYNTLDSIQLVAILNKDYKVSRMITALSKLFRYSMVSEPGSATLEEEIEYAENYVMLQRIRFEDAFVMEDRVNQSFRGIRIPRLTVQPLIENCIMHGLRQKTSGGEIKISAYKENNSLCIAIRDNGTGMTPQQLSEMQERLKQGADSDLPSRHIGILNVNMRLHTIYGPDGGVRLAKSDGQGTTVEIRIPLEGR